MPDIDEPLPLPENPQTVAELLPHLPIPCAYGRQYGMVFGQELADRLAEVQAENPTQHVAKPVQLTDGRHCLCADLLSAVPNGLYGANFTRLDASRFGEIALLPWAECVALLPQPESPILD